MNRNIRTIFLLFTAPLIAMPAMTSQSRAHQSGGEFATMELAAQRRERVRVHQAERRPARVHVVRAHPRHGAQTKVRHTTVKVGKDKTTGLAAKTPNANTQFRNMGPGTPVVNTNTASPNVTGSTPMTTGTTKTIVLKGLPPRWKYGDPLPAGWSVGVLPESVPPEIRYVPIPPDGWKPPGDTSPTATPADLEVLNQKVAECHAALRADINDYKNRQAGVLAQLRSGGDTAELNEQLKAINSMLEDRLQQSQDCYPRLFRQWKAAGYKL